jgi:hypothetical protein
MPKPEFVNKLAWKICCDIIIPSKLKPPPREIKK